VIGRACLTLYAQKKLTISRFIRRLDHPLPDRPSLPTTKMRTSSSGFHGPETSQRASALESRTLSASLPLFSETGSPPPFCTGLVTLEARTSGRSSNRGPQIMAGMTTDSQWTSKSTVQTRRRVD